MWTRPDRRPLTRSRVGPGPTAGRGSSDAGMATAELVVALPAIVLALLLGIGAVSAVTARMRCADAAVVAARLAARGERPEVALAAARRVAPPGATVHLEVSGDAVHVSVSAQARLLPLPGPVPPVDVAGSFSQVREPGPPP